MSKPTETAPRPKLSSPGIPPAPLAKSARGSLPMLSDEVRAKQKEFLFPCVTNYYSEPIVLTEGKGCRVKDADGHEYLDFFGGILTLGLGHSHPEVVSRVQAQLEKLTHTSTLYQTEPQVRVAEKLAQITPGKLKKSLFTTSGTEANETSILVAKLFTGRHEIIALRYGYSGRSFTAQSVAGQSVWKLLPPMMAGVTHALSPYCYRCPFDLEYPSCGLKCAHDMENVIQQQTTGAPAAFIAEPIQGAGGFIVPPKEYFEIAVGIVRKYGGVFICDEVQTAFGRTGDHWCGIEHWNVEPEVMTFAKSIASGFSVGATVAHEEVANAFKGLTISTFGGSAVTMTAADATIDVMIREDVRTRSAERGNQLRAHFERLKDKYPLIGDVRGMGLMQGMELVQDRKTKEPAAKATSQLLDAAKKQGLLIGKGGLYSNVIRVAPSMLVTAAEVDEAADKLDRAFASMT